jgi:hypothetical protein
MIMNKYFTIMLATAITSLAIVSSANAQTISTNCSGSRCGGNNKPVSEPAAAMVSLTALGLFVAARRRKTV